MVRQGGPFFAWFSGCHGVQSGPPAMTTQALFPTLVYSAPLQSAGSRGLNARLLRECLQLREDDPAGRRWSARNYPGGYTSYASVNRMHQVSPSFAALERALDKHVRALARSLDFDLSGTQARHDRLLGEHHAAADDPRPAFASAVDAERHVLRKDAAGCARAEARRSPARSLHGRSAAAREKPPQQPALGGDAGESRPPCCCSRAGCATRWPPIRWLQSASA